MTREERLDDTYNSIVEALKAVHERDGKPWTKGQGSQSDILVIQRPRSS